MEIVVRNVRDGVVKVISQSATVISFEPKLPARITALFETLCGVYSDLF